MNKIISILLLIATCGLRRSNALTFLANAGPAGTHPTGHKSYLMEGTAAALRYKAATLGTDTETQVQTVDNRDDFPIGILCDDNVAAGDPIDVALFGVANGTLLGRAGGTITAGNYVVVDADGDLLDETTAAADNYYRVGVALTDAVDGDEIEIAHRIPEQVTVI